jgi:selenide,water dikinase
LDEKIEPGAGSLAVKFGLRGGTDVTGFSLLGHASEMARASAVGFCLEMEKIPLVSCARKYAQMGTFPGGASDNRQYFAPHIRFRQGFPEQDQMLLFDPQTSGGLLLAVPKAKKVAFMEMAGDIDLPVWVIGEVVEGAGIDVD